MIRGAHENTAGPVDNVGFDTRGDQAHGLVVQLLPITRLVFGPDHEVDDESLQAPVRTRAHELANEAEDIADALAIYAIKRRF